MILNGKELSNKIKMEIKSDVQSLMIKPCLAVIQVGNDDASNVYIENKKKACNEVGIYFKHIKFEEFALEKEIINKIIELNNDEYVDGIILQLPLPTKFNEKRLVNFITRNKDVDGLTDSNKALLIRNNPNLIPCTPLGIMTLLKEYNISVSGKNVVIVGRSNLVGIPLFHLMLNNDATVTLCHSKTTDLINYTKNADILVSATGVANLITKDMVKKDAIVIDVGINRIDGKLVGDVDFNNVSKLASYITPVPGGVGPMTVCMLLKNTVLANKKKNTKN